MAFPDDHAHVHAAIRQWRMNGSTQEFLAPVERRFEYTLEVGLVQRNAASAVTVKVGFEMFTWPNQKVMLCFCVEQGSQRFFGSHCFLHWCQFVLHGVLDQILAEAGVLVGH